MEKKKEKKQTIKKMAKPAKKKQFVPSERLKGFYYHLVREDQAGEMAKVRKSYISLAKKLERMESRAGSVALTRLEDSLGWAMKHLALKGEPVAPGK